MNIQEISRTFADQTQFPEGELALDSSARKKIFSAFDTAMNSLKTPQIIRDRIKALVAEEESLSSMAAGLCRAIAAVGRAAREGEGDRKEARIAFGHWSQIFNTSLSLLNCYSAPEAKQLELSMRKWNVENWTDQLNELASQDNSTNKSLETGIKGVEFYLKSYKENDQAVINNAMKAIQTAKQKLPSFSKSIKNGLNSVKSSSIEFLAGCKRSIQRLPLLPIAGIGMGACAAYYYPGKPAAQAYIGAVTLTGLEAARRKARASILNWYLGAGAAVAAAVRSAELSAHFAESDSNTGLTNGAIYLGTLAAATAGTALSIIGSKTLKYLNLIN